MNNDIYGVEQEISSSVGLYVVAAECSRDHFISEKYKRVPSLKLYFLLNSPLCNYTILLANVKVLEILLEAMFGKPFQLFRRIVNDVGSIAKAPPFNVGFSRGNRYTSAAARPGKYEGCSSVVTLFFAKKSLTKTDKETGTHQSQPGQESMGDAPVWSLCSLLRNH
jgi:hypothetical protein